MTESVSAAADGALVGELFERYQGALGRFLLQMVRERALAEDLLQETFVEALRRPERVNDADDAGAWLFGIARHRALSALRGRRRWQRLVARVGERSLDASEPPKAAWVDVVDVLGRVLGPDDRSLVLLRYVHGFEASYLATMTGRSPAAVRKRLQRACERLAREVGDDL